MKIEKISENQIKFTLNRTDLASRQIKISELAYGTEKTKGLIQDMIDQASDELDFEFNDTPVMIEAIPVSMDCIVLMVTKIDEPEEMDEEFSGFSNLKDLLAEDEEPEQDLIPEEILKAQAAQKVQEIFRSQREKNAASSMERMFSFSSLEDVIEFAHQGGPAFKGESDLYSSSEDGKYYLVLREKSGDIKTFGRVCNTALEYGRKEAFGYARAAYVEEHFRCMLRKKALGYLSEI